jgi:serine/threonine protein kinase
MEYCDGVSKRITLSGIVCALTLDLCNTQGDLASQIKAARRNLFSESKILHWFVQLALGLHYMHGNKVLHRDLKTQNVFMLGNGRLVLGDLGISKVLDGTMDFAQTCIGTPYCKIALKNVSPFARLKLTSMSCLFCNTDMSPEIFKNKPYS